MSSKHLSLIAMFRITHGFQSNFGLLFLFTKIGQKHLKASTRILTVDPPPIVTTLVGPFYFRYRASKDCVHFDESLWVKTFHRNTQRFVVADTAFPVDDSSVVRHLFNASQPMTYQYGTRHRGDI